MFEELLEKIKNPPPPIPGMCDEHGPFESRWVVCLGDKDVYSNCPVCSTRAAAERADRERAEEEQRLADLQQALLRDAGIPALFHDATFDNYQADTPEMRKCLAIARAFATSQKRGRSLVMTGKPGTGKTHLACAIAREAMKTSRRVVFTTAAEVVMSVRATYRRDSELSEMDVLDRFRNANMLVIDEIGAQNGDEHGKTILFDILNYRYAEMLPTVICSNLSEKNLTDVLGERLMDRFAQTGVISAMDWQSWRRQGKQYESKAGRRQ